VIALAAQRGQMNQQFLKECEEAELAEVAAAPEAAGAVEKVG
jgi:hypothetical protein